MYKTLLTKLKSRLLFVVVSIVSLVLMSLACNKQEELQFPPFNPTKIDFVKPVNFPDPVYDFATNPLTEEGFELGRKLFYDGRLSKDGTISCGDCHHQANGFADLSTKALSSGVNGKIGIRNTTTIMNVAWSSSFFWDGNTVHLDEQPLKPIQNPLEMDNTMPAILDKIKDDAEYKTMFEKAFGTPQVTQERMLKALSQFMLLCVSSNSKYDKVMRLEGEDFTTEEKNGSILFKKICSACHSGDLFTDNKFHTNGILPGPLNDSGRYLITLDTNDIYFFKTPSLRNVAKTAPYMHDGRFQTLDEVLDHYVNTGIGINNSEKTILKAFLNTLTDDKFLNDPKLAKPK